MRQRGKRKKNGRLLTGVSRTAGEWARREKTGIARVGKIETRHTLAAALVQTEQTSETSGEEESSEMGRRWVVPSPAGLASSAWQTRDQPPSPPCRYAVSCPLSGYPLRG